MAIDKHLQLGQELAAAGFYRRQISDCALDRLAKTSFKSSISVFLILFDSICVYFSLFLPISVDFFNIHRGVDFVRFLLCVLELREVEVSRESSGYELLTDFAGRLEQCIASTAGSRDALLAAIPVEGFEQDVALPTEVLLAKLDVAEARLLALRRSMASNAKWHRRVQRERNRLVPTTKHFEMF